MAEDKNRQIAEAVVANVGGADNIASALHCMTRLRLVLNDDGLADREALKAIPGVLTVVDQGGQLQVVVGQNVPKVHAAVVEMGVASGGSVDEAPDAAPAEKAPLTLASAWQAVLGYLSGSMVPMIPVLMAAGLFKTLSTVLAPGMLGLVAADSNVITLLDFLYNAGFYFMPIYLGYNAATKLGATPVLGAFLGGILMAPAFQALAAEGASFSVFGIPCTPADYSSTVVPILLSVWVMSLIEKLMKRHLPDMLTTVFTPFLTMLLSAPVALCALAPLGGWIGTFLGNALYSLGAAGGIVSVIAGAIVCGLWNPLVATGMHQTIIMLAMGAFMETGVDNFVLVCGFMSLFSGFGAEIASFLRLKGEEKQEALGYFLTNFIGGVGEPFIYGVLFRHSRAWITMCAGAAVSGLLAIALGVTLNSFAPSSLLVVLGFAGGASGNLVKALIAGVAGMAVSLVLTYLFGFTKEEIEASAQN